MHLSPYIAAGLPHTHLMSSIRKIKQNKAQEIIKKKPQMFSQLNRVILIVSEHYNLSPYDLTGKCQDVRHKIARHVAIHIIRRKTQLGVKEIANAFNRHHSTIIHSTQTIDNWCKFDKNFYSEYLKVFELTNY